MEVTELMVGDWVYQDVPEQPYFQIEDIWDIGDAEEFEPIPITSEILISNGFIKQDSFGYAEHYSYNLPAPHMVFHLFAIYDSDFSFNIDGCPMKIKYVHELQHVLKLCKINKEIQL